MKLSFKLVSCFLSAASAVSMSGGLYSIQSFANEETVTLSNGGLSWLCDETAAFYRIRVVRADDTEEEVACFEWESTSIEDLQSELIMNGVPSGSWTVTVNSVFIESDETEEGAIPFEEEKEIGRVSVDFTVKNWNAGFSYDTATGRLTWNNIPGIEDLETPGSDWYAKYIPVLSDQHGRVIRLWSNSEYTLADDGITRTGETTPNVNLPLALARAAEEDGAEISNSIFDVRVYGKDGSGGETTYASSDSFSFTDGRSEVSEEAGVPLVNVKNNNDGTYTFLIRDMRPGDYKKDTVGYLYQLDGIYGDGDPRADDGIYAIERDPGRGYTSLTIPIKQLNSIRFLSVDSEGCRSKWTEAMTESMEWQAFFEMNDRGDLSWNVSPDMADMTGQSGWAFHSTYFLTLDGDSSGSYYNIWGSADYVLDFDANENGLRTAINTPSLNLPMTLTKEALLSGKEVPADTYTVRAFGEEEQNDPYCFVSSDTAEIAFSGTGVDNSIEVPAAKLFINETHDRFAVSFAENDDSDIVGYFVKLDGEYSAQWQKDPYTYIEKSEGITNIYNDIKSYNSVEVCAVRKDGKRSSFVELQPQTWDSEVKYDSETGMLSWNEYPDIDTMLSDRSDLNDDRIVSYQVRVTDNKGKSYLLNGMNTVFERDEDGRLTERVHSETKNGLPLGLAFAEYEEYNNVSINEKTYSCQIIARSPDGNLTAISSGPVRYSYYGHDLSTQEYPVPSARITDINGDMYTLEIDDNAGAAIGYIIDVDGEFEHEPWRAIYEEIPSADPETEDPSYEFVGYNGIFSAHRQYNDNGKTYFQFRASQFNSLKLYAVLDNGDKSAWSEKVTADTTEFDSGMRYDETTGNLKWGGIGEGETVNAEDYGRWDTVAEYNMIFDDLRAGGNRSFIDIDEQGNKYISFDCLNDNIPAAVAESYFLGGGRDWLDENEKERTYSVKIAARYGENGLFNYISSDYIDVTLAPGRLSEDLDVPSISINSVNGVDIGYQVTNTDNAVGYIIELDGHYCGADDWRNTEKCRVSRTICDRQSQFTFGGIQADEVNALRVCAVDIMGRVSEWSDWVPLNQWEAYPGFENGILSFEAAPYNESDLDQENDQILWYSVQLDGRGIGGPDTHFVRDESGNRTGEIVTGTANVAVNAAENALSYGSFTESFEDCEKDYNVTLTAGYPEQDPHIFSSDSLRVHLAPGQLNEALSVPEASVTSDYGMYTITVPEMEGAVGYLAEVDGQFSSWESWRNEGHKIVPVTDKDGDTFAWSFPALYVRRVRVCAVDSMGRVSSWSSDINVDEIWHADIKYGDGMLSIDNPAPYEEPDQSTFSGVLINYEAKLDGRSAGSFVSRFSMMPDGSRSVWTDPLNLAVAAAENALCYGPYTDSFENSEKDYMLSLVAAKPDQPPHAVADEMINVHLAPGQINENLPIPTVEQGNILVSGTNYQISISNVYGSVGYLVEVNGEFAGTDSWRNDGHPIVSVDYTDVFSTITRCSFQADKVKSIRVCAVDNMGRISGWSKRINLIDEFDAVFSYNPETKLLYYSDKEYENNLDFEQENDRIRSYHLFAGNTELGVFDSYFETQEDVRTGYVIYPHFNIPVLAARQALLWGMESGSYEITVGAGKLGSGDIDAISSQSIENVHLEPGVLSDELEAPEFEIIESYEDEGYYCLRITNTEGAVGYLVRINGEFSGDDAFRNENGDILFTADSNIYSENSFFSVSNVARLDSIEICSVGADGSVSPWSKPLAIEVIGWDSGMNYDGDTGILRWNDFDFTNIQPVNGIIAQYEVRIDDIVRYRTDNTYIGDNGEVVSPCRIEGVNIPLITAEQSIINGHAYEGRQYSISVAGCEANKAFYDHRSTDSVKVYLESGKQTDDLEAPEAYIDSIEDIHHRIRIENVEGAIGYILRVNGTFAGKDEWHNWIASDINLFECTREEGKYTFSYIDASQIDSITVCAVDSMGRISVCSEVTKEVLPTLTATAGDSEIVLKWEPVEGAAKYAVSVIDETGASAVISNRIIGETYTVTGLTNGTTYTYAVQAYISATRKWTAITDETTVSATPAGINLIPTLTAEAGDGEIVLSWEPVEGAAKYAVSVIDETGASAVISNKISGETYTVTGLTNGTTYTYAVQAYISATRKWTKITDETTASATPAGINLIPTLTAEAGDGEIVLSWEPVNGAAKYAVSVIDETGASAVISNKISGETYTVTGLTNGTTYTYAVQAYISATRKWTAITDETTASATPAGINLIPTLTAEAGDGEIVLSWEPVEGAAKYAVSVIDETGASAVISNRISGETYTVTGLTNGTTYTYAVQAYISATRKWTAISDETTASATPAGINLIPTLTAEAGDGEIVLSWEPVNGAAKYAVSVIDESGASAVISNKISGETYTVTGLTNGTTYTYAVQAYISATRKWTAITDETTASATPAGINLIPTLTAEAGDGEIVLSWEPVEGAAKYAVSVIDETGASAVISNKISGETYTVTGLTNGTTYTYAVQAYISATRKWTAITDETTASATPVSASQPVTESKIKALAGNGELTLCWDAVPGAVKYALSAVDKDGSTVMITNRITETHYTVKGLNNGETYKYSLQSYNGKKWTNVTEEYTVSAVPTAIKAKAVSGEGSITLSWEAVAGATKYAVSVIDEDGNPVILSNRITDTAFKADNLTSGKIYTYEIMAYNGRRWQSVTDEYTVSMIAG